MPGYLVLARKYRSASFDEVVGQDAIARTLRAAIEGGRIAQAYLFAGTRGVGKTTMARILAKALNCLSAAGPTTTPCGKCDSCKSIENGEDLDVIEIDGASNTSVDDIRDLQAGAGLHPARSRFKIYYIDEFHQISKSAFNALLKTLEEPPSHVKFIFATTEPEKAPATILSRCQRFDFRNIPTRKIAEHLKRICQLENMKAEDYEPDALFRLARAAAGSMRDGITLLDQVLSACPKVTDEEVVRVLGVTPEERVASIVRAIAEGNTPAALAEVSAVLDFGISPSAIASAMGDYFRNIMIALTCGHDSELIEMTDSQRQAMANLAKRFSVPVVVQAVAILQKLAFTVRSGSLARALVEAAVVRLAEADKFVDPQGLLDLLDGGANPPAPTNRPTRSASSQTAGSASAHSLGSASSQTAGSPSAQRSGSFSSQPLRPVSSQPPVPVSPQTAGSFSSQTPGSASAHSLGSASSQTPGSPSAPAPSPAPPLKKPKTADQLKPLSTAEKQEIQDDPTVQQTMKLFGGDVVDVRKEAPPEEGETEPEGS